jgi:hypothetical protein
MIQAVKLNLNFAPLLLANYQQHVGSCISHLVVECKDIYEAHGGFPESYTEKNTSIHQIWWDTSQLDFEAIGQQLGMEVVTISTICQRPGNVIPWHRDTFYKIQQQFPQHSAPKLRANIHLEDWKIGHFIQHGDQVATHWKAGEGWIWDSTVLHLGANAGLENKYTMQISGFALQ